MLSEENVGVDNVKVHSPLGQSDHNVVHFDLFIQISEKIWKTEYFDFRNGNYRKFKNYIKSKNWNVLLQQKSSDEMWTVFKTIQNDGVNKFVPK